MPALAISLPGIAGVARLTRATTLSVLREDYVRTARAKGLREFTVITPPRRAQLAAAAGHGRRHFAGDAGRRRVLRRDAAGRPGHRRVRLQIRQSRDYNVILALALILTTTFILANIAIDIAYTVIDPRVRYERQRLG